MSSISCLNGVFLKTSENFIIFPLEAPWVKLKPEFIPAMIFAYPYNIFQFWKSLLPALYDNERKPPGK